MNIVCARDFVSETEYDKIADFIRAEEIFEIEKKKDQTVTGSIRSFFQDGYHVSFYFCRRKNFRGFSFPMGAEEFFAAATNYAEFCAFIDARFRHIFEEKREQKMTTATATKRTKRRIAPLPAAPKTANVHAAVQLIASDRINPSPHNRDINPDGDDIRDLAASINKRGLLQPIAVRIDGSKYEIVDGERRWWACRRLCWIDIPALVYDIDERTAQADRITANLMRLNLTPLEEGDGVKKLLDIHGGDVSEVAARLVRSETWVRRRAKLTNLSPDWQNELAKRDTDYAHVRDSIERMEDVAILPVAIQSELLKDDTLRWSKDAATFRAAIARALHRLDQRPWPDDYDARDKTVQDCATCPRRSDREGDLFAALAEADSDKDNPANAYCLNAQCWEAKTAAYIRHVLAATPNAIPLQNGYMNKSKKESIRKTLNVPHIYDTWHKTDNEVGEDEDDGETRTGIIVNGPDVGKIHTVSISKDEMEEAEEEAASPKEAAEKKKEREKKRREEQQKKREAENAKRWSDEAFRTVLKKMLPEKIDFGPGVSQALADMKLLALLYNWCGAPPRKEELRKTNDAHMDDVRQGLWKSVRNTLILTSYYVNRPISNEERKAISECCRLDWKTVQLETAKTIVALKKKENEKEKKEAEKDDGEEEEEDEEEDDEE